MRKDLASREDGNVKCVTKEITLAKGQEYTATISFQAHEEKHLRGYFIQVTSSKYSGFSWHQGSKYPPSLEYVSPSFRVVKVVWLPNDPMTSPTTEVNKDTWIYARVTIHTDTGLANAPITFCVREDRVHGSDKDKTCVTKFISLPAGGKYSC